MYSEWKLIKVSKATDCVKDYFSKSSTKIIVGNTGKWNKKVRFEYFSHRKFTTSYENISITWVDCIWLRTFTGCSRCEILPTHEGSYAANVSQYQASKDERDDFLSLWVEFQSSQHVYPK